jgi:tRNA pseudouridine55 synthase
MEGVLLIDKPIGPSSFDVVKKVRALTGVRKVGHAGTLDPLASGLMILCLGRYTKLAGYLTDCDKVYESIFTLGSTTTTDDSEGEVIDKKPWSHIGAHHIAHVIKQFCGTIAQIPPQFSAVKVNGQPAYKLARRAQNVDLIARQVDIFDIALEALSLPQIGVRVHCSKGTYIRSLARDMGSALGVGAYASKIRRLRCGHFLVEQALSWEGLCAQQISSALLVGIGAVSGLEIVFIAEAERENIVHGRKLSSMIDFKTSHAIAICKKELVAIFAKDHRGLSIARVI